MKSKTDNSRTRMLEYISSGVKTVKLKEKRVIIFYNCLYKAVKSALLTDLVSFQKKLKIELGKYIYAIVYIVTNTITGYTSVYYFPTWIYILPWGPIHIIPTYNYTQI